MKHKASLQSIQNTALRIIFKKNRQFGNTALHQLSNIKKLDDRLAMLKNKFLDKAECTNNPIIVQLIKDFQRFNNSHELKPRTILCGTNIVNIVSD